MEKPPRKNPLARMLDVMEQRLPFAFGRWYYVRFPRLHPRPDRRSENYLDLPYVPGDVQNEAIEKMKQRRAEAKDSQ